MQKKRCRGNKCRSVSRPYTHVCKYTAKIKCIIIYGILKRKKYIERHANLKYKYGNRVFWCRGYYVSTVGNNKSAVYNYVENQLKEDIMSDQVTIKEYKDPFKG